MANRRDLVLIVDNDQAVRDAYDHYKAMGEWDNAVYIMREAAGRNPSNYSIRLDQAVYDAFVHYKAKGGMGCDKALDFIREAAERNPDKHSIELHQAMYDAFVHYKTQGWWGTPSHVARFATCPSPARS